MSDSITVFAYGENIEITSCKTCNGTGNMIEWNRKEQKHTENPNYPCETCKGSRYVVVSHWQENKRKGI